MISDLGVVLVAAGSSQRFGGKDKLLVDLHDKPLFTHSIATFLKIIPCENLVVVTSAEKVAEFSKIIYENFHQRIRVIAGGKERRDSALLGLLALPDELQFAAVHDAARPYLSLNSIEKCIAVLKEKGSAVLVHPVTDTIKIAPGGSKVLQTPPRENLFAAETPQMFERKKLILAYENSPKELKITDEAMAMELAGHEVFLCVHEEENRKITYLRDLL